MILFFQSSVYIRSSHDLFRFMWKFCLNSPRTQQVSRKLCLFENKFAAEANFPFTKLREVFVRLPQAPEFNFNLKTFFSHFPASFRGTSGIDIDLRRVDIDQCPQRNSATGVALPLNIFAGTDKCKQRTTEVRIAKLFYVPGILPLRSPTQIIDYSSDNSNCFLIYLLNSAFLCPGSDSDGARTSACVVEASTIPMSSQCTNISTAAHWKKSTQS